MEEKIDEAEPNSDGRKPNHQLVSTEFFEWCCKHFAQSVMRMPEESDPESDLHHEQNFRLMRAEMVQRVAAEEQKRPGECHRASAVIPRRCNPPVSFSGVGKLEEQIFLNRHHNGTIAQVLRFHPYEPHLASADKDTVTVWDWEDGHKLSSFCNQNPRKTRITALDFINPHHRALILTGSGLPFSLVCFPHS